MTYEYNLQMEKWEGRRTSPGEPDVVAKIKKARFGCPLSQGDSVYLQFPEGDDILYLGIVRKISKTGTVRINEKNMPISDAFVLMDDGEDENQKISPLLEERLKPYKV